MKFLLFAFIIFSGFTISCSSDDDSSEIPEEPQPTLYYLNYVTYQGDDYPVELYPDHKVKKIDLLGFIYEFSYEDNLVSNIIYTTDEGLSFSIEVQYDANDRINSLVYDGEIIQPIAFDPQTRTYSYTVVNDFFETRYSFKLNEVLDVERVTKYDPLTQESSYWGYQFDEGNKGTLWNSNSISAYVFMIKPNSLDLMLPFFQKPVAAAHNGDASFVCTNEFNDEGYLIHTSVFGRELVFNYIEE